MHPSAHVAEWADKPGSVVGRPFIFCLRCRRPHSRATRTRAGPTHGVPICPFSGWGLPSRAVADTLVRSYRTVSAFLASAMAVTGVFFSVALSVGSPRPAVSRHPALWSPDFPHRDAEAPPARPSGPLRNGAVYTKARRVHPAPRLSPRLHTTPPAPLGLLGLEGRAAHVSTCACRGRRTPRGLWPPWPCIPCIAPGSRSTASRTRRFGGRPDHSSGSGTRPSSRSPCRRRGS